MLTFASESASNILEATPGIGLHPRAHDRDFGDVVVADDALAAAALVDVLHQFERELFVGAVDGEADVLGIVTADRLEDDVDVDLFRGKLGEDFERDSGLVGHPDDRNAGHVVITRHPSDEHLFHFDSLLNLGAGVLGVAGEHLQVDIVFFRHLHRAVVEHPRAERRELEHLIVGDLVELVRAGNEPRVGGVHAVDVGIDLQRSACSAAASATALVSEPPRPRVVISS